MQRSAICAGGKFLVGPSRLAQRQFLGERHDTVQRRVVSLQPLQVEPGELGWLHLAALHKLGQMGDGEKRQFFVGPRHRHVDLFLPERPTLTRHRRSGQDRVEDDCQRGVVPQIGSPQCVERGQVTSRSVQDGQNPLLFVAAERQTRDRLGRFDQIERDRLGVLSKCSERARHQG